MANPGILNEQRLATAVPARAVDTVDPALARAHQAITQRAYELFEARGAGLERELDDWLCAERELFWQPMATVRERDDALEITIAMPGLTTDDVEVQVSGHAVLVQSNCAERDDTGCTAVHADELPRGRALRVFQVSSRLEPERAEARLRDGLLTIVVPLSAASPAREVPVAA